jgi:ribonuclease P protein component
MGKDTIRRQADFDRIFASGRRYRSPLLTAVVLRQDPDQPATRTAFVVSRKVARRAVRRNRVRRRLREAWRLLRPARGGYDIVVIVQTPAVTAGFWDLHVALRGLLRAAGVVRDDPGG